MDITDLYQEIILDHSKNPQNFGILNQYTCTAEGNNPMCGASLTVDKFHRLCMGEDIEDDEMETLKVLSGVSKFPTRVKCATMSWHAIKEATHSEN